MRHGTTRAIRACAQDYKGNPATYTGEIVRHGERVAVSCPEIDTTLRAKGMLTSKPNKTNVNFKIGISLSEIFAVPVNFEVKNPFI
jgi:hypothetical protein